MESIEQKATSWKSIEEASVLISALANPLRWQILVEMRERKQISVHDMLAMFGLEKSHLSQHLKILKQAGLVKTLRSKKYVYYSINHPKFVRVISLLRERMSARI